MLRSQAATCLFESTRRAEATVFVTRLSLKDHTAGLRFAAVRAVGRLAVAGQIADVDIVQARLAAKLTGWRIDIKSQVQAASAGIATLSDGGESHVDEGDGRCVAVTSTGIRCRNQARPGSRFCGVHEKEGAS